MDIQCEVCIAGGGPAGMMLGLLLARAGVDVVVLEKHADFLRDFRGDTVHPSTLDILDQLGLQSALARQPHRDVSQLQMSFVDGAFPVADFSRLRTKHPYIRFMPQWEFLNVVAEAAENLPTFRLLREHEVTDLRRVNNVVSGVTAATPLGAIGISATLTVAADGRNSTVREQSRLPLRDFRCPMDVLWFRLPRHDGDVDGLDMHVGSGAIALAIDRGDFWQIAYLVAKGSSSNLRGGSVLAFQQCVATLLPSLAGRVAEISDWDHVKTLGVELNRLRRWHAPGLLCIGDAAHAMSPVGGVGINLAIADAVAAANILTRRLRVGPLNSATLAAVQRRRHFPTVATQLGQRLAHRFLVAPALKSTTPRRAPLLLRLLGAMPFLQKVPALLVGRGLRPEHVDDTLLSGTQSTVTAEL